MNVEWKPVVGIPGYSVSNTGLVRSDGRVILMKNGVKRTVKPRILRPHLAGYGYLSVNLGATTKKLVHRLVATAFCPNPLELPQVNHIDENKRNNNADNLEWVTKHENLRYGSRIQRSLENNKKHYRPVTALKDGLISKEFPSLRAAERAGFNRIKVRACCNGKIPEYCGFTWNFANHTDGGDVNDLDI